MSESTKAFRSIAQSVVNSALAEDDMFELSKLHLPKFSTKQLRGYITNAVMSYIDYLLEEGVIVFIGVGTYRLRTTEEIEEETNKLLRY